MKSSFCIYESLNYREILGAAVPKLLLDIYGTVLKKILIKMYIKFGIFKRTQPIYDGVHSLYPSTVVNILKCQYHNIIFLVYLHTIFFYVKHGLCEENIKSFWGAKGKKKMKKSLVLMIMILVFGCPSKLSNSAKQSWFFVLFWVNLMKIYWSV